MKPQGIALDGFVDRMERALDVMSRRQQLIASNVGNVDTPGYRTKDLDFDAALRKAVDSEPQGAVGMRTTSAAHLGGSPTERAEAAARQVEGLSVRNDGNDVSIDREMLALAQTRGRFEVTASVARMRIKQLLSAIGDGGL